MSALGELRPGAVVTGPGGVQLRVARRAWSEVQRALTLTLVEVGGPADRVAEDRGRC
jgi:hypothetical protein